MDDQTPVGLRDFDGLKSAIQRIGRAADGTNARAAIIASAEKLGHKDLIPDSWEPDGTLRGSAWTLEQRETYSDISTALNGAVSDAMDADEYYCCWVQDFTDTEVIFYYRGDLWSVDYSLEPGGAVTLDGDAVKVRPVTSYVARKNSDGERELRERHAQRLKGTIERRQFASTMECRTLDDGTIRMGGYASVTETPYPVGPFTETIKRGAFKRTLSEEPSVVLLANHEGLPMASTKTGTLVLSEDARGLRWDADLDSADPDSMALARKVERGLIDECSFAFLCTDDKWSEDRSHRDVKSLSLHKGDVSCVTFGASEATNVGLRALAHDLEQRAGKTLSAKTRAELEVIQTTVGALLGNADAADEGSDAATSDDAEDLTDAARAAVDEQVVDETEAERSAGTETEPRPSVLPDYSAREREQLAKYRRAA